MSTQFIPDGVIREIPNGLEMVHDDVTSIDLFAERGQISKIPYTQKAQTLLASRISRLMVSLLYAIPLAVRCWTLRQ